MIFQFSLILFFSTAVFFTSEKICFSEKLTLSLLEESASDSQNQNSYVLKLRLKPKVVEARVDNLEVHGFAWEQEAKKWNYGLSSGAHVLTPIIMDKKNFYPCEEDFTGKYFWGSNDMQLRVFNYSERNLMVSFIFSANSYLLDRTMELWINEKLTHTIKVYAKDNFSDFKITDIVLPPGLNTVRFHCPEGTAELKPQKWIGDEQTPNVSVRFKNDMRFVSESILSQSLSKQQPIYDYAISHEGLDVIVASPDPLNAKSFVLMTRELDIDLEEYPFFSLKHELLSAYPSELRIFFGIDYNGDSIIDDYLELEKNEFNEARLWDSAKKKWNNFNNFKQFELKTIILLGFVDKKIYAKEKYPAKFRLKALSFYNSEASLEVPTGKIDKINVHDGDYFDGNHRGFINEDGDSVFFAYFDSRYPKGDYSKDGEDEGFLNNAMTLDVRPKSQSDTKDSSDPYKNDEKMEARSLSYPFSAKVAKTDYPQYQGGMNLKFNVEHSIASSNVLKLTYKLDEQFVQAIKIFLELDENEDGVVDQKIMAGNKEVIKTWRYVGTQKDISLFETHLSEKFPDSYTTESNVRDNFVVYSDNRPLRNAPLSQFQKPSAGDVCIEQKKITIAVPSGEYPNDNYSVIYLPPPKQSKVPGYQEYEADIGWVSEEFGRGDVVKSISINLTPEISAAIEQPKIGWYGLYLKDIGFYRRFAYPPKNEVNQLLTLLKKIEIPLIQIDDKIFSLNDFKDWRSYEDLEKKNLTNEIALGKGKHRYLRLDNPLFEAGWVVLEPMATADPRVFSREGPKITFGKINPTKYEVRIEDATEPFWLVFSEGFHERWKLYLLPTAHENVSGLHNIAKEHVHGRAKEANRLTRFTPGDLQYLFKDPLEAGHYQVNGYANGWYIDPKKSGLGANFTLILFFWPQSLFYFGLLLSGLTAFICAIYFVFLRLSPRQAKDNFCHIKNEHED